MPCGEVLGVAVERIAGVVEVVAVAELNGAVVVELEEEDPLAALLGAVEEEGRINAVRPEELGVAVVEEVVRAVVPGAAGLDAGLAVLFDAASTIALNATDLGIEAVAGVEEAPAGDEGCDEGDAPGAGDAIFTTGSVLAAGVGETPPAGFCPPCFALSERRRIRELSEVGLSKFNSPGAAPGSG